MLQRFAAAVLLSVACASAFVVRPPSANAALIQPRILMSAVEELPTQAAKQQAMYDMVYVERLPEESQMSSGLLLPGKENPRMHVCKVVSVGPGRESEGGVVMPNAGIKPGDLVYCKDPWGIGPRDDEFGYRKFSFVKYQNICAVLPDAQGFEADARAASADKIAIERSGGRAATPKK